MNVAIVDVGSNNIKLEIHGVDNEGNNELLYADKLPARLGHKVFLSHRLEKENEDTAIEGLRQFAAMIKNFSCKKTIALGTAALRETKYEPFIKRVSKETGINIKVIPGKEEARLCYLGALSHIPFNGRTFFLIDIGGGSTEISISDENEMHFIESFRLGTVRLKELFGEADYDKTRSLIENYVSKVIEPFMPEIESFKFDMGLATGGTAKNLIEMVGQRYELKQEQGIPLLKTEHLHEMVDIMTPMSVKDISKIKGLDKARADIIFPGAVLLLSLLKATGIKKSLVIGAGLRDGALSDYIYRKVNKKFYWSRQSRTRRQGLDEISKKFNVNIAHAQQCASLSGQIFDLLQDEHQLTPPAEDLMYASALLHDIGTYIDYSQHHKHSYYLISNSELLGFSSREKQVIALIARYHRKGLPKKSHDEYHDLEEQDKERVSVLSAILRIADALDRSYRNAVSEVTMLENTDETITLGLKGKGDLELELWSVERKKDFFEKVFKKELILKKV